MDEPELARHDRQRSIGVVVEALADKPGLCRILLKLYLDEITDRRRGKQSPPVANPGRDHWEPASLRVLGLNADLGAVAGRVIARDNAQAYRGAAVASHLRLQTHHVEQSVHASTTLSGL